jgi:hypothetical protein
MMGWACKQDGTKGTNTDFLEQTSWKMSIWKTEKTWEDNSEMDLRKTGR